MARINIEDSLLKDDKFSDLCIKLGSRIMALGTVAEAFIMAQKFYLDKSNGRLIPLNEWQRKPTLHVLVEVGLAEAEKNGIYIKGSHESFKWLLQKSDAGKMSAASKRIKRQKESTAVERTLTDEHGSQPLTPTLTPTLTLTLTPAAVSLEPQQQHFFEKFVFDELKTLDLGLAKYATKVDKAFINEDGFNEWVSSVVGSRSYKKIEAIESKKRYFVSALKNEIKNRGVV